MPLINYLRNKDKSKYFNKLVNPSLINYLKDLMAQFSPMDKQVQAKPILYSEISTIPNILD
jgi:hypothetical protein